MGEASSSLFRLVISGLDNETARIRKICNTETKSGSANTSQHKILQTRFQSMSRIGIARCPHFVGSSHGERKNRQAFQKDLRVEISRAERLYCMQRGQIRLRVSGIGNH